VKKLRRSNLSEDAYTTVKELLLAGKRYEPGAKISVEELSRQLGVSRTPIWGAIYRLEAEGIVQILPRQGVYLLNFETGRAQDIYTAREALEGMAARLAAQHATSRHFDSLRAAVERQRACLSSADVAGYSTAAMEFHEVIVEAAASETIARLLGSVYAQIQAMRVRMKYFPTKLPDSFEDHGRILQALLDRDAERAEREARTHLRMLSAEIGRA
jgi:DNA-binding GntR family transcriptional regulator